MQTGTTPALVVAGWVCDEAQQSFSRGSSQLIPPQHKHSDLLCRSRPAKGRTIPRHLELGCCFFGEIYSTNEGLWEAEGAATLLPCALTQKKLLQLLSWGCLKDALMADSLSSSLLCHSGYLELHPECPAPQTQQAGRGFSFISSFAFPSPAAPGFGIGEAPPAPALPPHEDQCTFSHPCFLFPSVFPLNFPAPAGFASQVSGRQR